MSRAAYESFFREADKDGSNSLTFKELADLLRKKGYRGSDAQLKKYFKSVDSSGDNEIDFDEYMIAMGQRPEKDHKMAAMRRVFQSFDRDGNGTIDKTEMHAVFQEMGRNLSESEIKRMIELGDKDKSGTLDYEEFMKQVFGKDV